MVVWPMEGVALRIGVLLNVGEIFSWNPFPVSGQQSPQSQGEFSNFWPKNKPNEGLLA